MPRSVNVCPRNRVRYTTSFSDLSAYIAARFHVDTRDSFLTTIDAALDTPTPENQLQASITEFFARSERYPDVLSIANPRWEAVLSLSIDNIFEDALRDAAEHRPVDRTVTVLTNYSQPIPPRSLPVLKLLGSLQRNDYVYSTVSYLKRRATWTNAVRLFSDRVKGASVLFLGLSGVHPFVYDLLATLFAQPQANPSALIFSKDDALLSDPQLHRLVDNQSRLFYFDGDRHSLLSHMAGLQRTRRQLRLPYGASDHSLDRDLSSFSGLVTIVNDHLTSAIGSTERHRLHELLFSPTTPTWDPYVHDLDFRRTASADIIDDVLLMAATPTPGSSACAIIGGSASGKTVILKRLAFDLVRRDLLEPISKLRPGLN